MGEFDFEKNKKAISLAAAGLVLVGLLSMLIGGEDSDESKASSRISRSKKASFLSSDQYIYYESEIRLPPARYIQPAQNNQSAQPVDDFKTSLGQNDSSSEEKVSPPERTAGNSLKGSGKDGEKFDGLGKDGPLGEGYNNAHGQEWNDWDEGSGYDNYDNF